MTHSDTPMPGAPPAPPDPPAATRPAIDAIVTRLAVRQHGVLGRRQLLAAGVPVHCVERRVRTEQFVAVHRGVYRVGPVVGPLAREMAAVLACGDGALLADRSAAAVWDFHRLDPAQTPDVLVVGRTASRVPGIRTRTVAWLDPDEATLYEGVPITAPGRTLIDLAAVVPPRSLEQALARAERAGLADRAALAAMLTRRRPSAGVGVLRALIAADGRLALTRSEAESRLLALIREARLPAPQTNVVVAGFEVDFLFPAERLIVEVDGYAYHASRGAFHADRRRDAALARASYRVIRLTWQQITKEPVATIVTLASLLRR